MSTITKVKVEWELAKQIIIISEKVGLFRAFKLLRVSKLLGLKESQDVVNAIWDGKFAVEEVTCQN